jgi:hypothetical protein
MKNLFLSFPIVFVLLISAAFGAEVRHYVVGVEGMT